MGEFIIENGVSITKCQSKSKALNFALFSSSAMKTNRELVLCALTAFCSEEDKKEWCIKCLETSSHTGLAGLQWKKHLKGKIAVTINVPDSAFLSGVSHNITENGLQKSSSETREDAGICVMQSNPNVVLHLHPFNFICMDPGGCVVPCLSSAFSSVPHGGLVILSSTDVATLYGKCPQAMMRNYGAVTTKNDYVKEMAVRILIAAAARAAATHDKGFEVLYAVVVEHFAQVALRVKRRAAQADATVGQINRILHCLMCEEWAVMPVSKTLHSDPYSLLPCSCKNSSPGMTAVELGPAWCGSIFDSSFLTQMHHVAEKMKMSRRSLALISMLMSEAMCSASKVNSQGVTLNPELEIPSSGKRKREDSESGDQMKKQKISQQFLPNAPPMFFYNYHKRHFKNIDILKIDHLVRMLQIAGFRASRTHFDPTAVRTNASFKQLSEVISDQHSVN